MQGPSLIFDKSSLESLNIHEAGLMDNFYMSTITPLFFVECLADLEKQIRGGSTPEQLVGSLADRTPDSQGNPNVHHLEILKGELSRQFNLTTVYGRVAWRTESVQLGEKGSSTARAKNKRHCSAGRAANFLRSAPTAREWRRSLTQSILAPW